MKVFSHQTPYGEFSVFSQKPEFNFAQIKQTHSSIIVSINELKDGTEGDGILSERTIATPLAIKTADCLPILLANKKFIAMIHAGWRGLKSGIIKQTFNLFTPTYAFIGPHIAQDHYEVGIEFKEYFQENTLKTKSSEKLLFSLKLEAKNQLTALNPSIQIESTNLDTFTQDELHSHRRDRTKLRNWNLFIPH